MRVARKIHCHPQARPAFGYLRRSAPGSSTQPAPCLRSPWCCRLTRSRWACRSAFTAVGNIVARSLCPLPSRMASWFVAKSTSFTRRRQHSSSRSPAPYSRTAMSRGTPERCWRTARTSSRVSTTGKCTGPLGPDDLVEPGQVDAEHLAVEKEQGAQGLVLGGGGDLPLNSERGQECGDFRGAHFRRMTLAVEEYVALDPVDIGLLSASAV